MPNDVIEGKLFARRCISIGLWLLCFRCSSGLRELNEVGVLLEKDAQRRRLESGEGRSAMLKS